MHVYVEYCPLSHEMKTSLENAQDEQSQFVFLQPPISSAEEAEWCIYALVH